MSDQPCDEASNRIEAGRYRNWSRHQYFSATTFRAPARGVERKEREGVTLMFNRSLRVLLVAALALLVLSLTAVSVAGATRQAKPDVAANFTTDGSVAAQFLANARTIPHWSFQYTDPTNGVTYPITMAGGGPRRRARRPRPTQPHPPP